MIKLPVNEVNPGQPEIVFPVKWSYRAVVDAMEPAALEKLNAVLEKYKYSERFAAGRTSSGQRYKSFQVEVEVPNREMMHQLAKEFGAVKGVKFVL